MINLGEAFENFVPATVAPEGLYDLMIVSAKATDDNGNGNGTPKGWTCLIKIDSEDNYRMFNHWVPNTGNPVNEHWMDTAVSNLKGFVKLFSVPVNDNEIDPEDFVGLTASKVMIFQENQTDKEGNERVDENGTPLIQNKLKLPMV